MTYDELFAQWWSQHVAKDAPEARVVAHEAFNVGVEAACTRFTRLVEQYAVDEDGASAMHRYGLLRRLYISIKDKDGPVSLDSVEAVCDSVNQDKAPLHVNHAALMRASDSMFKSKCPVCHVGFLMMQRDEQNLLIDTDRCILCAQQFVYDDFEDLWERSKEKPRGRSKFLFRDQPR